MIYEILENAPDRLAFVTHSRAQRGRGVLFATSPFVVYLAVLAFLFFLATGDLSLWSRVKDTAAYGAFVTAGLSVVCFALGYRVRETVRISRQGVHMERRPALGASAAFEVPRSRLISLALDPSLRSLGADVLLVGVLEGGERIPIAEGEPHSGQIQKLAKKAAQVLELHTEAPKFTTGQLN
jgi:hypothetical protein